VAGKPEAALDSCARAAGAEDLRRRMHPMSSSLGPNSRVALGMDYLPAEFYNSGREMAPWRCFP
jgi:hypothetical protein